MIENDYVDFPAKDDDKIWIGFDFNTITTPYHKTPKREITKTWNSTLEEIIRQAFVIINANSSRRLFNAELIKLRNSYFKINLKKKVASYKLFLFYKILNSGKYVKSKNLGLDFIRDLHDLEFREIINDKSFKNPFKILKYHYIEYFKEKLSKFFNIRQQKLRNCKKRNKHIHLILPLAGRFSTFKRFMANFAKNILICREKISLFIVYPTREFDKEFATNDVILLVKRYQKLYRHQILKG